MSGILDGVRGLFEELWLAHFRTDDSRRWWGELEQQLRAEAQALGVPMLEHLQAALIRFRDRRQTDLRAKDFGSKPAFIRWLVGEAVRIEWESLPTAQQLQREERARQDRERLLQRAASYRLRRRENFTRAGEVFDDQAFSVLAGVDWWRRLAIEYYTLLDPERDELGAVRSVRCPADAPHTRCLVCGGAARMPFAVVYSHLSRDDQFHRWGPTLLDFLENGLRPKERAA